MYIVKLPQSYSQTKKYIAIQGKPYWTCLKLKVCIDHKALNFVGPFQTLTDFWLLVWQEQVHVVAMVISTV